MLRPYDLQHLKIQKITTEYNVDSTDAQKKVNTRNQLQAIN